MMLKFATTDSDNRFTTFTATSPRGEVDCETLMYPKKFEEARRAVQKVGTIGGLIYSHNQAER